MTKQLDIMTHLFKKLVILGKCGYFAFSGVSDCLRDSMAGNAYDLCMLLMWHYSIYTLLFTCMRGLFLHHVVVQPDDK